MPTQADVRQIALSLPGAFEESGRFAFGVTNKGKPKHFVWVWLERFHPKKARVPNPKIIAIRVANETEKATLLGADTDKFFTEPHYNGYPAVMVRLENVTKPELRSLLTEAWRCAAPATIEATPTASANAKVKAKAKTKTATKPKGARKAASAVPKSARRRQAK